MKKGNKESTSKVKVEAKMQQSMYAWWIYMLKLVK